MTFLMKKHHMPYGNVIIAFLASMNVNITLGIIQPLSKNYKQIGSRQLSLFGMEMQNNSCLEARSNITRRKEMKPHPARQK